MTDEKTQQLENRIDKLDSTIERMMPSRRDALKMGGAALVGGAAMSGRASADTVDDQVGTIGGPNEEVDLVSEDIDNSNQITTKDLVVNGTATGPFGSDLQGCRVFLSSEQSYTGGSGRVKIQFDSVVYDSDNNFDTNSHAWTCPKTGLYSVVAQASHDGSGDDVQITIGSSSSDLPLDQGVENDNVSTSTFTQIGATTINKYSQGDTIAAYFRNRSGSDTIRDGNRADNSFMEVAFLGSL